MKVWKTAFFVFLGLGLVGLIIAGFVFYQGKDSGQTETWLEKEKEGKLVEDQQLVEDQPLQPRVAFVDERGRVIAEFEVEVARTPVQRQQGLMNRRFLAEDQGMLFILAREEAASFWMKNTLIALDIIYLTADQRVKSIVKNAQPCEKGACPGYPSQGKVKYVLEVNGGLADELGIEPGMKLEFDNVFK